MKKSTKKQRIFPIALIRQIPRDKLSANERIVLIMLMDYINCDSIYASAKLIADQCALSEQTVLRVFKKLEKKRLMVKKRVNKGFAWVYEKELDVERIKAWASEFDIEGDKSKDESPTYNRPSKDLAALIAERDEARRSIENLDPKWRELVL